jgi:hypothetical protein
VSGYRCTRRMSSAACACGFARPCSQFSSVRTFVRRVSGKETAGKPHVLPDLREFVSADLRHRFRFHSMRAKCSFAGTLIGQSIKPLHQFIEQNG